MSCLFDSLSKFTTHSSSELRQLIISYFETNPKLMNDETTFHDLMKWDDVDKDSYINEMKKDSTWGSGLEIKAFVNMFNVNVFVHVPQIQRKIEFVCDHENALTTKPTIEIIWTGNHYIPLHIKVP